jgi:hypothetical protein
MIVRQRKLCDVFRMTLTLMWTRDKFCIDFATYPLFLEGSLWESKPYNMKTFTTMRIDKVGHVAELVFTRGKKLNSMTPTFFSELEEALQYIKNDPDTRACLIRGEGRAFTAGLDLSEAGAVLSGGGDKSKAEVAADFLRVVKGYQVRKERCRRERVLLCID